MKKILFLVLLFQSTFGQNIKGSWRAEKDDFKYLLIATENYFSITKYQSVGFSESWGGKYEVSPTGEFLVEIEFHSANPAIVNSTQSYNISIKKKSLELNDLKYEKNSEKDNELTGLWRITGRASTDGQLTEMQPGPRKTIKIMGGGCFQWFAINTSTREFFGTGGGVYTLKDGKYTEKIEYFSRDNSRIGAELSFEAQISDNKWQHAGKSSKGEPIREIWTKL